MRDMERYEIMMSSGPRKVSGVIIGPFAVRDVSGLDGPRFQVDHLFTGCAVEEFDDEDQAAFFCLEANELDDWTFTDPSGVLPVIAFSIAKNAAMDLK